MVAGPVPHSTNSSVSPYLCGVRSTEDRVCVRVCGAAGLVCSPDGCATATFFLPLADIADVAQRSLVAGPRPGQHPTAQSLTVTFLTGLYSVLAQPPLDFREYEIRLNAYVRDE
jgi:hypothetical protein